MLGSAGFFKGIVGTAGAQQDQNIEELRKFSEVSLLAGSNEVNVEDNIVLAVTEGCFSTIDIQNPTKPEVLATVEIPGAAAHDAKIEGDLVAAGSQGDEERNDGDEPGANIENIGTHFYNVSDPTDPQYLSTFPVPPGGVHNQYIEDDVAYLCREVPFNDSALIIVDVSDPENPVEIARWAVEDEHPELDQPTNFLHDVYIKDDLAYLAYWDAGCRVLDVSDPSDPVEVSWFAVSPDADDPVSGTFDEVFDDPESEFSQRALGLPGQIHSVKVSPDNNFVYLGTEVFLGPAGGMSIWDVSDLQDPMKVSEIDPPDVDISNPDRTVSQYRVTSNRLHSTWRDAGVRSFDVTDPADPEEIARFNQEGFRAGGIDLARSFILVGGEPGVVFLHDDRGNGCPNQ